MDQLTTEQYLYAIACLTVVMIFGTYGSYVACAKNRAWYEGFWMGVFMGPFGVVVMACLPTLEPARAYSAPGLLKPREEHDDEQVKQARAEEWAKRSAKALRNSPIAQPKPAAPEKFPMF